MRAGEKDYNEILESFSDNIRKAVDNSSGFSVDEEIDNIVIFGLGEQNFAANIIKDYFSKKLDIAVVSSEIPTWTTSKTLVFVLSYDDKDEAVDFYGSALRKGAKIVVVSFKGRLEELCNKQGRKYIKIPYGVEEKESLPYFIFSPMVVLHNSGLVDDQTVFIKDVIKTLSTSEVFSKKGKELAKRIAGKVPLIYSTEFFRSVAQGWKVNMNKVAEMHSFTNTFPEVLYSELYGFQKLNGYYYVIVVRDAEPNMKKRKMFEEFRRNVKAAGVDILEIGITGGCDLTKLFSALYMGMWAAYYVSQDVVE
jgi:bifunctional phosphoglucose/phosphomannose isomerase